MNRPTMDRAMEDAKSIHTQQYTVAHKKVVKAFKGTLDEKSLIVIRNAFFDMWIAASKMNRLLDGDKEWEEKENAARKSHSTTIEFASIVAWGRHTN